MLLAAVLALEIAQPVRLRTILPNGAAVLAVRVEAPMASAQVFLRTSELETPATHGHRHLLEHLVAKGPDGLLDQRLESQGLYLSAATARDFMRFEVSGPARAWREALAGLGELFQSVRPTEEGVRREADVLDQELAITPLPVRLAGGAWRAAYGDSQLDPLGAGPAFRTATPEGLRAIQERTFVGARLVVAVAGPFSPDEAVAAASAWAARLPSGNVPPWNDAGVFSPGAAKLAVPLGRGIAVRLPPAGDPSFAPSLAAAMAATGLDARWRLLAAPSPRPGIALVWQEGSGNFEDLLALDAEGRRKLFGRGRAAMRAWLASSDRDPRAATLLRGTLLAADPGLSPESLRAALDAMTPDSFEMAMRAFTRDRAVEVASAP